MALIQESLHMNLNIILHYYDPLVNIVFRYHYIVTCPYNFTNYAQFTDHTSFTIILHPSKQS